MAPATNDTDQMTKRNTLRELLFAGLASFAPEALAATLDDVQFWVGTGANQAGLVIDWRDGKSADSLLWGYRWDGAATGLDMLEAVVNADPQLFAHLGTYSWGTAVLGMGYDLNPSGSFAVSPPLPFDSGGLALDTSPDDARVAVDEADHWLEGWNGGFWAYYHKGSATEDWESAAAGPTDRTLANGAWDGFSFAPGFASSAPSEPAPVVVPEPKVVSLLTLGTFALLCGRRRTPPEPVFPVGRGSAEPRRPRKLLGSTEPRPTSFTDPLRANTFRVNASHTPRIKKPGAVRSRCVTANGGEWA